MREAHGNRSSLVMTARPVSFISRKHSIGLRKDEFLTNETETLYALLIIEIDISGRGYIELHPLLLLCYEGTFIRSFVSSDIKV